MNNIASHGDIKENPFVIVNEGVVIEANEAFAHMTGVQIEDFLYKNIEELFRVLRIGPDVSSQRIIDTAEYFLFTSSLEVKFFNFKVISGPKESVYMFLEKPGSDPYVKCPIISALYLDNYYGVGIYSMPDMTLLRANDKCLGFLNAPFNKRENCIGKHITEFVTGFKGSAFEDIWSTVIETRKSYNIEEFKYEGFNRETTYWKLSLIPISEDNKIKYCVTMAVETTEQVLNKEEIAERKKMEKELEQQKRELEVILDNINDGFYILDIDGNYIKLNKKAKEWAGPVDISTVGCSLDAVKYYDKDGKELSREELPASRVLKGEKLERYQMVMKYDGTERYVSISGNPIYDESGNMVMAVFNSQDVTGRAKQSQTIKKQKELLEAIVDNLQESLYVVDENSRLIIMNKSAQKYQSSRIYTFIDLYNNEKRYNMDGTLIAVEETAFYRAMHGIVTENRIIYYERGGEIFYSLINGIPVFDELGNFLYGIVTSRDITVLMRSQQALENAREQLLNVEIDKNEALKKAIEMKDEFLSLISHEFRTPLNVINTAIQALNYLCGIELSDRTKKYINIIRQNTFRQLRLVNNLLDITSADAGRIKIHKRNVDIVFLTNSIVESVRTYSSQKGIKLTFEPLTQKKIIGMDDEKYERILLNLLSNAIKFTPEGRRISVNLRTVKNRIRIEVKDNGIGIPEDKVEVIFERFGQVDSSLSRQAEGSGIGLSLVKKLVDALGGSISVKSRIGRGSTFTILLPDEMVTEEQTELPGMDLLDNHLVQVTTVEFSDIYL
ncbi:MAG: ATP-binding protein [Bacillota bacterium]|nr:ATP-binding protein [Bacillota bacterium]